MIDTESDEQVIQVEIKLNHDDEKTVTRFVIMDTHPSVAKTARYRTSDPLESYNAWTAFASGARHFITCEKAQQALLDLWEEREASRNEQERIEQ